MSMVKRSIRSIYSNFEGNTELRILEVSYIEGGKLLARNFMLEIIDHEKGKIMSYTLDDSDAVELSHSLKNAVEDREE